MTLLNNPPEVTDLRDRFAEKALPVLAGRYKGYVSTDDAERIAKDAYMVADAMLKARKERL